MNRFDFKLVTELDLTFAKLPEKVKTVKFTICSIITKVGGNFYHDPFWVARSR